MTFPVRISGLTDNGETIGPFPYAVHGIVEADVRCLPSNVLFIVDSDSDSPRETLEITTRSESEIELCELAEQTDWVRVTIESNDARNRRLVTLELRDPSQASSIPASQDATVLLRARSAIEDYTALVPIHVSVFHRMWSNNATQ